MPEDMERLGYLEEESLDAEASGDVTEVQKDELLRAIKGKVEAFRRALYRSQNS